MNENVLDAVSDDMDFFKSARGDGGSAKDSVADWPPAFDE